MNTRFTITKWSQDQCTRTKYLKDKEKKKIQKVLTTSLINIPLTQKSPILILPL